MYFIEGWSDRLREQRELIGLNQSTFGEMGGVKKQTQIAYEQGKSSPDLKYLQALETNGVDIRYVLTGQRSMEGGNPSANAEGADEKEGDAAIDAEALAGIIEGVEKSLAKRRLKMTPEKKAQVVSALYEYSKATGKASPAAVERFLNLTS